MYLLNLVSRNLFCNLSIVRCLENPFYYSSHVFKLHNSIPTYTDLPLYAYTTLQCTIPIGYCRIVTLGQQYDRVSAQVDTGRYCLTIICTTTVLCGLYMLLLWFMSGLDLIWSRDLG